MTASPPTIQAVAKWKHDDLLYDLADHLAKPERMLWCDLQLGPSGSSRLDIYTMRKSFADPRPLAYEIKISVSDYRSDITSGKWQSYLKFAGAVTFCVPQGLITKADLPNGCGLMVRGENGWRTLKAATQHKANMPQDTLIKLLIHADERRLHAEKNKSFFHFRASEKLRKQHGNDVCNFLHDRERARQDLGRDQTELSYRETRAIARADGIIARANKDAEAVNLEAYKLKSQLAELAGVPPDSSMWKISHALELLRERLKPDLTLAACQGAIMHMRRALADAEQRLSPERILSVGEPLHEASEEQQIARIN